MVWHILYSYRWSITKSYINPEPVLLKRHCDVVVGVILVHHLHELHKEQVPYYVRLSRLVEIRSEVSTQYTDYVSFVFAVCTQHYKAYNDAYNSE